MTIPIAVLMVRPGIWFGRFHNKTQAKIGNILRLLRMVFSKLHKFAKWLLEMLNKCQKALTRVRLRAIGVSCESMLFASDMDPYCTKLGVTYHRCLTHICLNLSPLKKTMHHSNTKILAIDSFCLGIIR